MEKMAKYSVRLNEVLNLYNSMMDFEYGNVDTEKVKCEHKELFLKYGEFMMLKEVTLWFEQDLKEKAKDDKVYNFLTNEIVELQQVSKLAIKTGKNSNISERTQSKLHFLGMIKGCNRVIDIFKNQIGN